MFHLFLFILKGILFKTTLQETIFNQSVKTVKTDGFKAVARGYDRLGRQRFKSPERS